MGRKWDGSGTEAGRKWDGSGTEVRHTCAADLFIVFEHFFSAAKCGMTISIAGFKAMEGLLRLRHAVLNSHAGPRSFVE